MIHIKGCNKKAKSFDKRKNMHKTNYFYAQNSCTDDGSDRTIHR